MNNQNIPVGGVKFDGVDIAPYVGDLVSRIGEYYSFNNGETALYFHLLAVINMHLNKPLE